MNDDTTPLFGFRTAGYRNQSLAEAFESIARHGYDGVEICLEHPQARPEKLTSELARHIARMARDCNLQIAAVSYHGDEDDRSIRAQNQRRAVQLADQFDTRVAILNAEPKDPQEPEKQWDDFRNHLAQLLSTAQQSGVLIALEPEPGHFLHSSADMMRLISQVNHSNLKVNLDVGHAFLTDDDVARTIGQFADDIVHTHIEGMPADRHKHLLPGRGDLDLTTVADALDRIGYDGYYTVDLFDIAEAPDDWAGRSIEALRRIFASTK